MYISTALTAVVLATLPFCVLYPWIGMLVWSWLGYMNPHRLTWAFTYEAPFAQMVAIATLIGTFRSREPKQLPLTRDTWILIALFGVFTLSTAFAMYPALAWPKWADFAKIFLFNVVLTLIFFQDRQRLRWLLIVIAGSFAFYAIKGAVFTILTGGVHRVMMPERTSFGSNNAGGLALNMVLGLFLYLAWDEKNRWVRRFFYLAFGAGVISIIFTYSRGAFVGLVAVGLVILLKSQRRILALMLAGLSVVLVLYLAPQKWIDRMETIESSEMDASVRGRFEMWYVCWRLALDRPLLGGGFWANSHPDVVFNYNPEVKKARNAHSIYFNALGEHGFLGLGVVLTMFGSAILTARRLRRPRDGVVPPAWIVNYSHAMEVGIIAYAVNGAFLSVLYVDLIYHFVSVLILLTQLARREHAAGSTPAATGATSPVTPELSRVWNHGPR